MKTFLLKLAVFSLPIFLEAYFADLFLSHNLAKSKDANIGIWNDIYQGNLHSDLLVYGSSRATYHFDPKIMSDSTKLGSYVLGEDGHNFWMEYFRHSMVLKYNPKPKIIIYSLDMFTLEKRKDLFDPEQLLPYMLQDSAVENILSDYEGYDYLDYKLPLIRYYGRTLAIRTALRMFVQPHYAFSHRTRGYDGENKVWDDDPASAKAYQ